MHESEMRGKPPLDLTSERLTPLTQSQMHDTSIYDRPTLGHPPIPYEGLHDFRQGRPPHTKRPGRICQSSLCVTTHKKEHGSLERRHADWLETSSERAMPLQHPLQGGHTLMTVLH